MWKLIFYAPYGYFSPPHTHTAAPPLTQEYVWINIYNSKYVDIFLVQNCLFMQLNT